MNNNILVLGAGLVGGAIAKDLKASGYSVTSADKSLENLDRLRTSGIDTLELDFSDLAAVNNAASGFDLVVGAVPGFLGFSVVKALIEAGKNVVDISFFPEEALELDELAKQMGVTVITDCGVAPGLCNIILGYHYARMRVESYKCMVGGLPLKPEWPYRYKAVFSPIDVIEEYTRPARLRRGGKEIILPALSEIEQVDFPEVGRLEAFNTDGLRSLLKTTGIPDMAEKTLRYPGSAEYLEVLRETGFFSSEPVSICGQPVRPVELTAKLLFPLWKLQPGEEEFTIMRIEISGTEEGKSVRHVYTVFDRYDAETGTTSMARTTGYTCTAAVNLVLAGSYNRKGVSPAEFLGEDAVHYNSILRHLEERNITVRKE